MSGLAPSCFACGQPIDGDGRRLCNACLDLAASYAQPASTIYAGKWWASVYRTRKDGKRGALVVAHGPFESDDAAKDNTGRVRSEYRGPRYTIVIEQTPTPPSAGRDSKRGG